MEIVKTIPEARELVKAWRGQGLSVGLVPTMGYFHEGHLALMRKALELNDRVVVSLFVNPTQFGPQEDLDRYPRDLERDVRLAQGVGVHALFTPTAQEMYPPGYSTFVEVEGSLTGGLCGASRPGHFRGVATVVTKLFNIIEPDTAVFGEKDFQQLQVIRRMVRDLDLKVEIVGHPIVREPDGLAMSSRNSYLSAQERRSALALFKALKMARKMVAEGVTRADEVKRAMEEAILSHPFTRIDYIFIGEPSTLEPTETIGPGTLVALAVWVGETRLIDNMVMEL